MRACPNTCGKRSFFVHFCFRLKPLDARGQNNCRNNTFEVANILLSEGVTPSLPLFLATGLSNSQLESWRAMSKVPSATDNLFNVFTTITHDTLAESVFEDSPPALVQHKMFWPAVFSLLSLDATIFIGNSASTFSGMIFQKRLRLKRRIIQYNGGGLRIQDTNQLVSKQRSIPLPSLRRPIKWVFCVQPKTGGPHSFDESRNMAKVAIKSALSKTSLVPVGVTTADPMSKFAIELVSMGVRLIYHKPSWRKHIASTILRWNNSHDRFAGNKKPSHLLSDIDAMVGTFLRIDVPILGILDSFIFYTDIDVLFQNDITWNELLGPKYRKLTNTMKRNYFSFDEPFAQPERKGLPAFFAMSAEVHMRQIPENAGVMLMNMVAMRTVYDLFLNFILDSGDITWKVGPGDQGALRTFFSIDENNTLISFLPLEFNWKAYWPKNPKAAVVHFHGPKCEMDILPYFDAGKVRFPLFQHLLNMCKERGTCYETCQQYQQYLHA